MKTATKAALAVGDSVYCVYDPGQEPGVIVATTVNPGQWLVTWGSGKTWIYHTTDLARVES